MNCALLGEGSSDRVLLPVLRWVLERATPAECWLAWVDTSLFTTGPKLADKVRGALTVHPCRLLFVHRDADNQPPERRFDEIRLAAGSQPHVAIVPIRTTEAWLLIDEAAIRAAAGRVSGREPLGLPALSRIEQVADPKRVLRDALMTAHGATGRRARRFHPADARMRLADLVDDWSPLRQLSACRRLEADTRSALAALGLPLHPQEP
ncbi:MAG: hypothetical protein D6798_15770 [Deltaproteobacteria bacterium]|nr:MAG: hypothetical protein D6798_15770 [Deltaproteobacteria bacterium]